jgi:hypothetical protein
MARGDHIRVRRVLYWHHGIDLGDGTVIHASGEPGQLNRGARVRRDSIARFLRGGVMEIVDDPRALPAEEVVDRAEAALGRTEYSVLFNNCEHFAHWCQVGRPLSRQVEQLAWTGAAVGVAARLVVSLARRRAAGTLLLRALPMAAPLAAGVAVAGLSVAVAAKLKRDLATG